MDLLQASHIQQHLSPEALGYYQPIEIFETLDSTNSYLLEQKCPAGSVCLAEHQTAGRGRHGRVWVSPDKCNIYLSTLCEIPKTPEMSSLSLVVGFAVIQAIAFLQIPSLQIKWPNDIVHQGRKLGGILLEVKKQTSEAIQIVIGIGLNVYPSEMQINQSWINLAALSQQALSRNMIVGQILNHLYDQILLFKQKGLSILMEHWQTLDILHQQTVFVQQGSKTQQGIAQGINAQGYLQVNCLGKILSISSGEVTLVRKMEINE